MAMTKKEFEAISAAISKIPAVNLRDMIADSLMPIFKKSNPKFDPDRFIKACNGTSARRIVITQKQTPS